MNNKHDPPGHEPTDAEDMLPEYDFSGGTRGKYAARYKAGNSPLPALTQPHPFSDILGQFEGEAWEEHRAMLAKLRQRDADDNVLE